VHPSTGKGKPPNEKVIPMGSPRMDRFQLIELAKWILAEMDEDGLADSNTPPDEGEDIPEHHHDTLDEEVRDHVD